MGERHGGMERQRHAGTFSRHTLERFIQEQQFDIFQTRQQRLVIETLGGIPVGALDFFELDPINRRAGIGILIHDDALRGKGYASDVVETACRYACEVLNLHQLWCNVGSDNAPAGDSSPKRIRRSRRQTRAGYGGRAATAMKFCCRKSSDKRSQYNPPHKRSTHDKHPHPDFSAPAGNIGPADAAPGRIRRRQSTQNP
ncbi:MAG: GNAT family N-acetyltransferase [Alistipes finegoldii]